MPDAQGPAGKGKKYGLTKIMTAAATVMIVAAVILFYVTQAYVISQAEKNINNLLLAHRGMHLYVQRIMHPAFYKYKDAGEIPRDFYAPELLSSSYIVRSQHAFYNEVRVKDNLPVVYYKMAADNPRNPVNKADALEERLIRLFNDNRELQHYSETITLGGKRCLYYAIPFLANEGRCLKCHGRREDAPLQLQARYPGEGGFNENVGRIRAIESIRAPLQEEYRMVIIITGSLFAGVLAIVSLFLFNHRLRVTVRDRTGELESEIHERLRAEAEVRELNQQLEARVVERTAQLDAANKELDAFSYSVSHDLRAPLRGINGFSTALLEDYGTGLDATARDYIDRICAGCVRMGELIDDLLRMSRLSRGELSHCRIDLTAMAMAVVEELARADPDRPDGGSVAGAREGTGATGRWDGGSVVGARDGARPTGRWVRTDIAAGMTAWADPALMRAVLDNLLGNAWKFTAKTPEPFIAMGTEIQEGRSCAIPGARDTSSVQSVGGMVYFVRDNGAGFDMKYAGKLFSAFQRLHSPGEFEGTGIGLATVQRIIHRHGGRIWAEAEPGKGATFYFTLPAQDSGDRI